MSEPTRPTTVFDPGVQHERTAEYIAANFADDVAFMEDALRDAAEAADATVLHIHVHEFGGEGGVSGVAVLAESHISVHTWPELEYAAFDVFMCGNCRPEIALSVLEDRFAPARKTVSESIRGLVE